MQYQTSAELENFVEATGRPATLIELLDQRALQQPDQLAYTFLLDGETSELHLTYGELQRRAHTIAATLQCSGAKGGRALLFYPPGLDFIEGFFGCLYAGVVAVPAYPPHFAKLDRTLPRLQAIIANAQATFVLTTSPILARTKLIFTEAPDLKALQWLATDKVVTNVDQSSKPEHASASDLAFLQYTSGSTGHPRGVMLTHSNLLHNARLIFHLFEHAETDSYVSWLPMFHDMGFMVGVLQPLYAGIRAVLLSPVAFLQRPARWLEAISRYRATTSGGPNFAYDLCARKITAEDAAALDLSSWSIAFNGAEPVRAETLDRFASCFGPFGFRRAALFPCYGLAEATLVVTGGRKKSPPIIKRVESKLMVGCGGALQEERVIIVDPSSLTELKDGHIGEIWVSGPSVAKGYWNRPEETDQIFNSYLADSGQGPFLRTEDLGFIEGGELYITGRIKDLIIIRGLNHYPQDIEWTVERCHGALRPACGAAFTVDAEGEERLVIVQEIDTRKETDLDHVIETIREAVASEHELQVHAVALIKPGQISKTSSGKIQRRDSRRKFLEGALDAVAEWRAAASEESDTPELVTSPLSAEAINSWLASQVAAKLGVALSDVHMDQPLARYGLDSLMAVELTHSIETRLGVTLPMVSLLQGSSVAQIGADILSQLSERTCRQTSPEASPAARCESENDYSLSFGQQGLWFLHNLAPESVAYNIARAVKIRAALDVAALRRAFVVLLERHAALRTTFVTSRGRPIQRVADRVEMDFREEDARHWSETELDERLTTESERPFNLERGPLLRIILFTRSNDEHILLLAAHHIIVDFWSLALLMQELGLSYERERCGVRAALPALTSSYSAFVRWQKDFVSSEEGERHWEYWRNQLSRELPILNLPTTRPRPPVQTFRGASHPLPLSVVTARRLRALSREHHATLYVTLLATFQALLYLYSDQKEFFVGSVTAGRSRAEFAPLIGYFVNPLVFRAKVSGDDSFESLLVQVRQSVLDAFEHQDYPFSILVERLQAARDPSRSPLFQVMFSMHKAHLGDEGLSLFALGEAGALINLGGLELESVPLKQRVAQFDLTLMVAEAGEELYATFEYNTDLFDATTIGQMAQNFRTLLDAVVANPAERISNLPLGQIDRSALPPQDGVAVTPKKSFTAPRTKTEQTLAGIWSELLGIKSIGVNDNFFEMGGDSILSIQVVARAEEAGIAVTPRQMFQHQTIAELAEIAAAGTVRRTTESDELAPVNLDQRQLKELAKSGGEIEDIYPLTPTQKGMLFHSLAEPDSGVYMTQLVCELRGGVDVEAFQAAWQTVVSRHQSLRADFEWEVGAEPVQVVRREVEVKLSCEDWREFSRERQDELLEKILHQDREQGFDLRRAPLLRLAVFSRSDEEHAFVLSNHHLLIDGWSLSIVLREVFAVYDARRVERAPRLKVSRLFKDYVAWLGRQDQASAESFWRETLKGFTEPTPLGIESASANSVEPEEGYGEESLRLSEASTELLQAFARQNRLTLSTLLYGAWAILLSRYSGERDIVFGVTSSGRPPDLRGAEAMVGLFINTLPLRVRIPSDQFLIPWLKELQKQLVELRQYEYSSLFQVQEWSEVQRGRALFESIFVFENYPVDSSLRGRRECPELTSLRSIEQTNYPLTIAAMPGTELALHAGYKTDRFNALTVCQMLRHLETLLEGIVAAPNQRATDLSLLSAAERNLLIRESSETQVDFPSLALHELFERQATATPSAVALIFEGERLSYQELNGRANQLAHYLCGLGVKRGSRIAICLERSPAMIVGLLGILKAGGAYLPLDPEYPKERLAFMHADAQPEMVVTTQPLRENLPEHGARVICLDAESESISRHSEENPSSFAVSEDLAYVIYTSGSTGQPKGVMISHRAVCNHMQWIAREFPLDQSDRMLLKYSISFDAAIEEIFHPLMTGAGLVIVPPGCQYDIGYLVELMCEQRVTAIDAVPTMLKALIEDGRIKKCRSLLRVTSGGEVLSAELKDGVCRMLSEVELVNMYGPTEAAITTTYYRCALGRDEGTVPIGGPVANTRIYILDRDLEPVPAGVSGEIYIGGKGLAWGYLNQPQLTAEKFIPDPLSGELGARLYKSGDWGRYSANGNLEYVGRLDGQVKVRGFRIELQEIEARLKNHEFVKDAVVIVRVEAEGDKRLVAYVVCDQEETVTPDELRAYLKDKLPQYMLPGAVVLLDTLPFKGSGKVNVQALPPPDEITTEEEFVGPRTPVEKELARIWREVLGLERVGITDNFFEVGGDSIVSIQIVARARDAGLSITPKQVLKHESILKLAAVAKEIHPQITQKYETQGEIGVIGGWPLTPIQHWFLEQQLPNPHHYNQAVMLELKQPIRTDLLEKSLGRLIEYHEALRLRFEREARGWKQTIAACETHQILEHVDLSSLTPEEQTAEIKTAADQAQSSLHLSAGPLIRTVYFDLGIGKSHRLLIVIHHLAVDGVSWRILLDDMQRTYEQLQRGEEAKLPPKTLSFMHWSELLSAHAQSESVLQELEYWTAEPRGNVAKLPVDRTGDNRADSVRSFSVALTAEETRLLLQEVPRTYRTQINDVLLAALAQALSDWTRDDRVLVDVEGHGREEIVEGCDLSRTVGWFTTIFPVLLEVSNPSGLGETLKSVKEQLRRVPNRGIGYGLLRYLRGDETVSSHLEKLPQAQVSFNYLGQLDQIFHDETFVLTNDPVGQSRSELGTRKYLIDIDGGVRDGRLQMEWVYSEELHARQTIEVVAENFIRKLRRLIEHCVLREVREYTPSDFPLVNLNERQLKQIQRTNPQIEDLYPLSPMQEGMLFHSLYSPESGIYTTQLVCELNGHLSEDIFEMAWQAAVDAHAVLRTGFEWKAVGEPVQVVRRSLKVRVRRKDWKSLGRKEQEEKLEKYLRDDHEQEFDMKQPPLMRLTLVRTADDLNLLIWTSHHLLLDGWSLPIVVNDVLAAYDSLRSGNQPSLKPARSYRDYISWVKKQDLREAERFWRQLLKGFRSPTPLGTHENQSRDSEYAEQQIQLTEAVTARLLKFAQRHQLTPNTVVQGAWALLLSSHVGREDVVFGVVVSGRSVEVADVESMVGLFINTLPARTKITPEVELIVWLKQLQAQQVELGQYEYSPLARVQAWSEVEPGKPLFESIFLFENYPITNVLKERHDDLRVGNVRSVEKSNYPLTVWAMPGQELVLRIGYDTRRFDDESISRLLRDYQKLLEAIALNPQRQISELRKENILGQKRKAAKKAI